MQCPDFVAQTDFYRLFGADDRPDIAGEFAGRHHQLRQRFFFDRGVADDKPRNPFLNLTEVLIGLRSADDRPADADRMQHHGSGGGDKRPTCSDGEWYADGVTAAENQGHCRGFHSCDEFRDGKSGLHIAADCVEQDEKTVDFFALLDRRKLRKDVFIFCGFSVFRRFLMSFDRADDGNTVDDTVGGLCRDRAKVRAVRLFAFV